MNIYSAFKQQFQSNLDKPLAITPDGTQYSYRQAELASAKIANFFISCGLKKGDRVTVQIEKSPQMLWLYLAILRSGLVYHPLNTAYTDDEVNYFLTNAEPSLIICDNNKLDSFQQLANTLNIQKLYSLNSDGSGSLLEAVNDCSAEFDDIAMQPDEFAALLYSSGTTGKPKGIPLSHGNLLSNASTLIEQWQFSSDDYLLHALPIFHVHGLFVGINCVLLSAASMRWLPRFDVELVMQQLPHSTVMMGVPTYYTRLLSDERFNREIAQSIRLFVSGSAPLLTETFNQFEEVTGSAILERFGMTETGMNTSNPYVGKRKAGTVGPPLPGTNIIVVTDDLQPCAIDEVGNILVKGNNVFSSYWRMPEKTAEDFTDNGFFKTGDQGFLDSDGYLNIVGRSKDMVICGGLNVYPKELELILNDHDAILESAVIGLPHPDFGEAVAAVVVCNPSVGSTSENITEAELISFMKQKVANFKVPKRIFFVDQLPRNAMSKVQKAQLRATYSL